MDDRVTFSFYQGPKRIVPLFSLHARSSFVKFCREAGRSDISQLPADRQEFNDDDQTVGLPAHVAFVPRSNDAVWKLWEDWVMQCWFQYSERMATTVLDAQRGNPYFGGAFSFQLAGWYSIRSRSHKPVSYSWRDANGSLRHTTNEVVRDWERYDDLNPVSKGQDLEQFAQAPWFSGFIHEASSGVPSMGCNCCPMVSPLLSY